MNQPRSEKRKKEKEKRKRLLDSVMPVASRVVKRGREA
jgi:hypothetical protein